MKILVTGGAGFIGSHLVDALIEREHDVRVFDELVPQVHGAVDGPPAYLNPEVEFVRGDVQDKAALRKALQDVEVVYHEAAEVGVGQSMYEVTRYVNANTAGTGVLLEILANEPHTVQKLIVASSMSIYGEGAYECPVHWVVHPQLRPDEQLEAREWEVRCPVPVEGSKSKAKGSTFQPSNLPTCNRKLEPIPTSEDKPLFPTSIYAISKMDQELMCLSIGRAYDIPTVALRYFNVYGPRQALSNPYTGVAAIFSSRLLNGNPPLIFEDGQQSRDFVHVSDIVQANLLALERDEANFGVFNVGTGRQTTVLDVAHSLAEGLGVDINPEIVDQYRAGDIRHCYADITRIRETLGFEPQVQFEDGMRDLIDWVRRQESSDLVDQAKAELEQRGLAK
ncbi:MAG: dTDP-L-rhamnose 4-epimerase [Anaerolineales bacterium]|nr:dTDP-L-rhamnose 4-epimerase [Anaerolineales bacterium]